MLEQLEPERARFTLPAAIPVGAGRVLLVAGDSWFRYIGGRVDLATVLESKHGFKVSNLAQSGKKLAFLAKNSDLSAISDRFNDLVQQNKRPAAILISAGGNDVVGQTLLDYVLAFGTGGGLDDAPTKRMMDGKPPNDGQMRVHIHTILEYLKTNCLGADKKPIPVIWQGYDDPIPDSRILNGVPSPGGLFTVLYQYLTRRGYSTLQSRFDVMQQVVIRYNALLAEFSLDASYRDFFVHANLRGTLVKTLAGDAYKQDWSNEMHPTQQGFEKLALALVTQYVQPVLVP